MPNPSWTEPMVPFKTVVNSFRPARWAMVKTIVIKMARFTRSFGERKSARQRRRREKEAGGAGPSENSREESRFGIGTSLRSGAEEDSEIEDEDENEDDDDMPAKHCNDSGTTNHNSRARSRGQQ